MKIIFSKFFRIRFFVIYPLLAVFASCGSSVDDPIDPKPPFEPYLTLVGELPSFSPDGSSAQLQFSTNEPWYIETAAEDDSWFRVGPSGGGAGEHIALTVHADANDAYVDRSFTLSIRTTSLERSVEIAQLKRNAIIASGNRVELDSEEQTFTVEIQANVEYDVEVSAGGEWLSPAEGTRAEPGLTSREHRFTVAANTVAQERTATIVFKDLTSDLQDEVTVVQAAWEDPNPERTALVAIYRAAQGTGWTRSDNWCSDRPLDEWYGVATDAEGHVMELRLPQNNLRGELAHAIAQLTELRILDLSRNELDSYLTYAPDDFSEPEHSDLDQLTKLEEIDLSRNRLKSQHGSALELKNMRRLRRVDLSYNELQCWVSYKSWAPLFENGRTVELHFNGNQMHGDVDDCIMNHPEWNRLAMQLMRQYYPGGIKYSKAIHVPEFTFTDLRTGAQESIRTFCSRNERTMLLAWDPTEEDSRRFAERSVYRYHTLYEAQGFGVVAILPEGETYRQAAEQYLATHEVKWPVVSEYADAQGRRIVLPAEPYPSYLLFDREGKLVDDVHNQAYCPANIYPEEPATFDLAGLELQYADYMNDLCYKAFGNCTYESRDYSMDKQYETLQRAAKGQGVNIVLIGDVFTDVDIETGYYLDVMKYAMESFFSVEPTKSYREYFNVYAVYAVSKRRQVGIYGDNSALGTELDKYDSSGYAAYPYRVEQYIDAAQLPGSKTFPSVIINRIDGNGVTYFESSTDATAYVPYRNRSQVISTLLHEAMGHGFGFLGDAYWYPDSGEIPESEKQTIRTYQRNGSFLNLSLTKDPKSVPWAHLIGHPRYPEVGVIAGGNGYQAGVWNSGYDLMRSGSYRYFNPVDRELLVKQILTFAGEEYTFEKFLEKDVPASQPAEYMPPFRRTAQYEHCPPIFLNEK